MSSRGGRGYNYRQEFFKKNKGLFGLGIYICPYCGLPVTKKNCHVDHIIPKSKSEALFNRQYNLVASHPRCNQKKSDKIDHRVVQGYTVKIFGGLIGGVMNLIFSILLLPLKLIPPILGAIISIITGILGLIGRTLVGTFGLVLNLFCSHFILITVILFLLWFLKR